MAFITLTEACETSPQKDDPKVTIQSEQIKEMRPLGSDEVGATVIKLLDDTHYQVWETIDQITRLSERRA